AVSCEHSIQVGQKSGTGTYAFSRTFPVGQDWSDVPGLSFWYYGRNSNKNIGISLDNNQAAIGTPSGWKLVWSDEFNSKAGAAPNASIWGREVGDGTVNGMSGWGTNGRRKNAHR